MLSSLVRATLLLTFIGALFMFTAQAFGRASRNQMLAYVSTGEVNMLHILDMAIGVEWQVETVEANAVPVWSADGRLAFVSDSDDNADILVWDTQVVTNISQTPDAAESDPAWSADGRLSFLSEDSDGNLDIYVWDGTSLTSIFQPQEIFYGDRQAWSANGQLAFASIVGEGSEVHIWQDGALQTIWQSEESRAFKPTWRPNGDLSFLVYGPRLNQGDIMLWDGVAVTSFSQNAGVPAFDLAWSADGRLLAYVTSATDVGDLYVSDGVTVTQITYSQDVTEESPVWSADGRLAFRSHTSDNYYYRDIYIWDGTTVTNITDSLRVNDEAPAWSADGLLAFTSSSDDEWGAINIWDGTTITQITHTPDIADVSPVWSLP